MSLISSRGIPYICDDCDLLVDMMSMVIVSAGMPMMALMIVIALKIINAFKPMIV